MKGIREYLEYSSSQSPVIIGGPGSTGYLLLESLALCLEYQVQVLNTSGTQHRNCRENCVPTVSPRVILRWVGLLNLVACAVASCLIDLCVLSMENASQS